MALTSNRTRKFYVESESVYLKMKFASNFMLNGIVARTTWMLAFCVLLFVFEGVAGQPFGGSVARLDGQWFHNGAADKDSGRAGWGEA